MPRKPTGTIYEINGRIYAQVTVGHNKRRSFVLPDGIDCDTAERRATTLAGFATKLRMVGLGMV
mgnify:CR=1 FL=1